MIITPAQMNNYVLKLLDDVVKDFPEDEREQAKVNILNALSAQLFNGTITKEGK